jgi:hypothetical protein
LLERIYAKALALELSLSGLGFEIEKAFRSFIEASYCANNELISSSKARF